MAATVYKRGAVDILKKRLEHKILELDENMTSADVDEIAKITASIERMEKGGVDLSDGDSGSYGPLRRIPQTTLEPDRLDAELQLIHGFFRISRRTWVDGK